MELSQTKKIISWTFKIKGTLVFLCPFQREGVGREGERERERERENERKSKSKREREKEKDRETKRERTKVQAIILLNRSGQKEKSANYI